MTDAELIQRIRSGEDRFFGDLVERYLGRVWALCSSYIRNRSDCEDVVQESFIQCYRRLDTLRDPVAFARWLGQVARTQSLTFLRASMRRETAIARHIDEDRAAHSAEEARPDNTVERKELHDAIRAKIETLPPKYREALSLVYTGGHSVAEAAEFAGINPDAMKKRLQLGREKLRDLMADEVEAALADRKPREQLKARVVTAIPVGTAAWLGKAGVGAGGTATVTAKMVAAWGTMSVMSKTLGVLLLGALGVVSISHLTEDSEPAIPAAVAGRESGEETKPTPKAENQIESVTTAKPITPAKDVREIKKGEVKTVSSHRPENLPAPQPAVPSIAFSEKDKAALASMEDVLNKPISLDFGQVPTHICEILSFIGEYLEANIVLDWRVTEAPCVAGPSEPGKETTPTATAAKGELPSTDTGDTYITDGLLPTTDFRDVTLLEALEQVLYPLGLDFVAKPGWIWVSSPRYTQVGSEPDSDEQRSAYAVIEEKLATNTSVVFHEGTHVSEVLDFLSEFMEVNIVLDSRVIQPPASDTDVVPVATAPGEPGGNEDVSDGIVRYVKLEDVRLRDALEALLCPLNLTYTVKPGYLWVSSSRMIKRESSAGSADDTVSGEMADLLDKAVSVEWEKQSLDRMLASLRRQVEAEFQVDPIALAPARMRDETDATDNLMVWFAVEKLPLRHVLDALLRQFGLAYVAKDSVIRVSTPERLRGSVFDDWREIEAEKPPMKENPSSKSARAVEGGESFVPRFLEVSVDAEGYIVGAEFEFAPDERYVYKEGQSFEGLQVMRIMLDPPMVYLVREGERAINRLAPGDAIPL